MAAVEGNSTPTTGSESEHITVGTKSIPDDHAILAVPKKGRLHQQVLKLLEGAGLEYTRPERVDVAVCENIPLVIVFLPASDIATFVGEGNVDVGITGLDHVQEASLDVDVLLQLGFGKCSLSVQAPITSKITDVKSQVISQFSSSLVMRATHASVSFLLGLAVREAHRNVVSKYHGGLLYEARSDAKDACASSVRICGGSLWTRACGRGGRSGRDRDDDARGWARGS